jgi:ketosteroid isomerase-like protein
MSTATTKQNVLGLISLVENGRMLDAMTAYYADDVAMQENVSPPTVGFAENYAREAAFYGSLQALKFTLVSYLVEGDHAVINWVFDYTTADGQQYRMDEISWQTWRDGKIVRERYIYDTATLARTAA